jgi:hypothetical protein
MTRQRGFGFAAMLLGLTVMATVPAAAQSAPKPDIAQSTPAQSDELFKAFQAAVAEYVALQRRLRQETPPLQVTDRSADISNASDVLAAAVQRARPRARQGDFFDGASTRLITARLKEALDGVDVARLMVVMNDPPTLKGPPRVYMRFPGSWSMATMPPNLLAVLPSLPAELEFRFVGRALILRDRDAALILDYVTQAIPPR